MARKKAFYCSIHGGPIFGRGFGGHKSKGTCKGRRLLKAEYMALIGDRPMPAKVVPPRFEGRVSARPQAAQADPLVDGLRARLDLLNHQIAELEISRRGVQKALKALER